MKLVALVAPVDPVQGTHISQRWMARPEVYARFGHPGHLGLDIGYANGWLVVSVAPGIVERIAWDPYGYGYWAQVQHSGFYTRYAHGIRGSAMVEVGDVIAAGTPLFRGDTTGFSTGDHLHFEVRTSTRAIIDMIPGIDGRWYMSDGGNYVLDPTLFLPAPYGEGREIGDDDVNDTVLALEKALALSKADRNLNYAKFIEAGADLGDAIRILNRTPLGAMLAADVARRTELNTRWAGKV